MSASPYRTFVHDAPSDAAEARLRAVAIAGVSVGITGVALTLPNWVGLIFVLMGTGGIAGWARKIAQARARMRRMRLELTPDALTYHDGVEVRVLAWSELESVGVDEDRLEVRIERRAAQPMYVEPLFAGASVYDVADAIRAAWRASTGEAARSDR